MGDQKLNIPMLIYAAGMGTRMRELTKDQPKPLIKVAGRALIDHAMDAAASEHISKIVVNTQFKASQIHTHPFERPVLFSDETQLLETGGGLKNALPLLDSEVTATLNSDAVWSGSNPTRFALSHWHSSMAALLLVAEKSTVVGHKGSGDFDMTADGRLIRGSRYIFTGLQITQTALYAEMNAKKFSSNVIWDQQILDGTLFGAVYPGHWCDVGYPEAIPLAEDMLNGIIASDE
ncbi:MurNAc alpha-1-phosphate uridylyltransferase [Cognatiyoonia sediminum]|uniref:MurNAc alpha-1-phosphate uridylyltransferase n=1 Tax=Cognatiyoonia sediminum TaxID=1508389 RepID=A0A1M5QPW3_9RHOB|nr:nucleotidyltransferase family protein [Cognatiyoonia sediminum]SHH15978.1 MurNAc alpha-1-phosphate uridylyltransferase [Cognatiyoonia sediminum]